MPISDCGYIHSCIAFPQFQLRSQQQHWPVPRFQLWFSYHNTQLYLKFSGKEKFSAYFPWDLGKLLPTSISRIYSLGIVKPMQTHITEHHHKAHRVLCGAYSSYFLHCLHKLDQWYLSYSGFCKWKDPQCSLRATLQSCTCKSSAQNYLPIL